MSILHPQLSRAASALARRAWGVRFAASGWLAADLGLACPPPFFYGVAHEPTALAHFVGRVPTTLRPYVLELGDEPWPAFAAGARLRLRLRLRRCRLLLAWSESASARLMKQLDDDRWRTRIRVVPPGVRPRSDPARRDLSGGLLLTVLEGAGDGGALAGSTLAASLQAQLPDIGVRRTRVADGDAARMLPHACLAVLAPGAPLHASALLAFAHGVPLLAIATDATRELLEDGASGVAIGMATGGSLAEAAAELLADRRRLAELAENAYATVIAGRFSLAARAQLVRRAYLEALGVSPSSPLD